MKTFLILVVLALVLVALWAFLRRRQASLVAPEGGSDAGQELRGEMLTRPPQELGISPTDEFPQVYGVLMDFAVGEHIATVLSTSTGAASLYTTSTFGVLGGEAHEPVRIAAKRFVGAADRHYEAATPTADYPYPSADRVFFYLLTFDGVRRIDTSLEAVNRERGEYAELYQLGHQVLSELRMASGG